MNHSRTFALSVALLGLSIVSSCQRETEIPETTESDLQEVVFHAVWAPETKTVLQEDGSVWWSPGDEISLFVNDGQEGGYKLTATNTEPAAKVDFIGQIGGDLQGATFTAIYPYHEANRVDGNYIFFTIPTEQTAKEGTFENGMLVSYAVSDNESLMFHNLCGGIKFSVAHEGVKKVEIWSRGANALSGDMMQNPEGVICAYQSSNIVTVLAPNGAFEVGKYYYVIVAASEQYSGHESDIVVSYYTDDSVATAYLPGCLFKRSTFKRLYEADKELKFKKYYDKVAYLPYDFLPEGVDKTTITEAYFHVLDPTTTETIISEGGSDSEPIYFEKDGTTVHFYTTGQVYKCYGVNFEGWKSLRSLDLSMFDTSDVVSLGQAFMDCHSLQNVDLSSFDTSNALYFGNMFNNCVNLRTLDVTNFDTSKAVDMYAMFANCISLTSLDVSSFNTASVSNFNRMFASCSGLKRLELSGFDTSSATELTEMFAGCTGLESIDLSGFNTSNVRNTWALFSGCWNLKTIDLSFLRAAPLEIVSSMFSNCRSLVNVDLSGLDLSEVIGFDGLLNMCSSLQSVKWPTTPIAKVQWMQYMFDGCASLEQLDLSSFYTSNLTEMRQAFHGCTSLKTLDLSHFDTKNVMNMSFLFSGCTNLEHLDISSFDSSHLTEAYSIFFNTHKLTYLDLGDFNLENVTMDDAAKWFGDRARNCHIRCTNETKSILMTNASWLSQDRYIWYTDGSPLPDVQYEPKEALYCSTDYSKDKTVRTVQLAQEGAGIDLVLMGDAYSDRLIASGKYDEDMEKAIDAIFAVEPFKSFKRFFNIYIVYAVSENEIVGQSTALNCFNTSRPIGSSGWAWESYYFCAARNASPGECSPVVIMNSDISDGAANGFQSSTTGDYLNDPLRDDYHGGVSEAVAYISGPDADRFDYTVRHEFGHTFGFLMDEYSNYSYAIPDWEISSWQFCFAYGMWKNVDLVSDDTVKWAKFIHDPRYSGTGIGVYEGALYETGAWRSTPESIMNSTDSGFNAPSREAIYYKIHKLAYGRDWEYNYEDFVTYDLPNIEADRARLSMPRHSIPSFKRQPIFEKSTVIGPDGKERIKITME